MHFQFCFYNRNQIRNFTQFSFRRIEARKSVKHVNTTQNRDCLHIAYWIYVISTNALNRFVIIMHKMLNIIDEIKNLHFCLKIIIYRIATKCKNYFFSLDFNWEIVCGLEASNDHMDIWNGQGSLVLYVKQNLHSPLNGFVRICEIYKCCCCNSSPETQLHMPIWNDSSSLINWLFAWNWKDEWNDRPGKYRKTAK